MKKKIALVLTLEPREGGGYQYALLMAECLKRISRSNFELIAICPNRFWWRWCKDNGIRYIRVNWFSYTAEEIKKNLRFPLYSRIYNMYMTEIGKVIRKEKIDILILTGQLMYIPNLAVKVITPVFDLMHRYEPSFSEVRRDYQDRELIFKSQAKYADYILTDSELGKEQFCESYLKERSNKPYVISLPFAVPGHILNVREKYMKTPDKYVFYPAQFWKHKNHINLIKAIQILKKDICDIHLVLVGSEKNCLRQIKKYIVENGLEDNITILGFVCDENIVYLYRHAVALIMPTYFGPTNIPPLEAMALGCPVAVSNKYAMPEQIGEAGLLFNPDSPQEIADCIRKLWLDKDLRTMLSELGYQIVRGKSRKEFERRVCSLVRKCIYN